MSHVRASNSIVGKDQSTPTPVKRKQGESKFSFHKMNAIQSAVEISARIFATKCKGGVHLIDLNAGDGCNHQTGGDGTAIVLAKTAARVLDCVSVRIAMVDKDRAAIERLRAKIPSLPANISVEFFAADNGQWLREGYSEWRRQTEPWGVVVADPNGVKEGFPARDIEALADEWRRMDVIVGYASKMANFAKKVHPSSDILSFDDIVRAFRKSFWTVQVPASGDDQSRRTVMVGRNARIGGEHAKYGVFQLSSVEGQKIREYCERGGKYPDVLTADLFTYRRHP